MSGHGSVRALQGRPAMRPLSQRWGGRSDRAYSLLVAILSLAVTGIAILDLSLLFAGFQ